MSITTSLKAVVFALIVFGVAFGLRRGFFGDVAPVSWDQEPQSLWALGVAYLLCTLENIATVVAGLALTVAVALRVSAGAPPKLEGSGRRSTSSGG
jgi:hypothetical protein